MPNSTLLSSQEGPDWVVTVGATDPDNSKDFTGTGKPADVAGIGHSYPTSFGSTTTSNGKSFSGTSNATPQVAGTYGRTLWEARRALPGASRTQAAGVVAKGGRLACGRARACELGDGVLTAAELRTRLLQGATPTAGGFTDGLLGAAQTPAVADSRFAAEGHGTFRGRLTAGGFESELTSRILGPLLGRSAAPARPAGESDWFRVDSACRQHLWGAWSGGAFVDAARTPQPAADPVAWPTRTAIQQGCPLLLPPPAPIV